MGAGGAMMGMQIVGGWLGGKTLQEQYKAEAYQAEMNAARSQQMASDAIQRGNIAEEQARARGWAFAGTQKAAMGASGVEVASGSFLNVLSDTYATAEYEALSEKTNAAREAWGYKRQAENFMTEAAMKKYQARNALMTSMLGGATQATGTYLTYKDSPGAFGKGS